jgi:hypothetical protein
MKISTYSISSSQGAEFEELSKKCKLEAGYKWLSSTEIPSAIPDSLRSKMQSALLMWERTTSGSIYLVCNGIRLDKPFNELDQEPFGIVVNSSGASTYGLFIHHGNWNNRTIPITPEVRQVLDSTSLGNYFPLGEVSSNSSGALSELRRTSHEGAFKAVLQILTSST